MAEAAKEMSPSIRIVEATIRVENRILTLNSFGFLMFVFVGIFSLQPGYLHECI